MSQIADLQEHVKALEVLVERRDLALKLNENRAFRKLILEDFCVEECAKYAQASGDPALKPEDRKNALELAQAAGHIRRWLSVVVRMGNQAARDLEQTKQEIDEVNAEEA